MLLSLHTILVTCHLLAVALGLGAALIADWVAAVFLMGEIVSRSAVTRLVALSRVVTCGVVLIWATGAVLVGDNVLLNAASLTNQKLWAKLLIVALLTSNAVVLHHLVLPSLPTQVGSRLFDGAHLWTRAGLMLSGSVSSVSWLFALVLGVARELNGVVKLSDVLTVYVAAVTLVWIVATLSSYGLPALGARRRARLGPCRP